MNSTPEQQSSAAEERPRLGREGKAALKVRELEQNVEEARKRLQEAGESGANSETVEAARVLTEVAEDDKEIFFLEHDATGALKGDRLGRDLAGDMREHSWERDKEGQIPQTPEDERSHLLFINMGELDRLNASGDHALGDQGLRLSAEHVEKVVREVLGNDPRFKDENRLKDAYDVYRYSGNDFALNLRDVDKTSADEINRRLSEASIDMSSVRPGEEAVPLTSSRVSRADGLNLLNSLDQRPDEAGLSDQKVLIDAMLGKAQALNDIAKLERRATRMVEKLSLVEKGEMTEDAARSFYEKFMKKSLGSAFKPAEATDAIGFESFKRLAAEKGAFGESPSAEWTHLVSERSMDDAFESLKARRAVGREIDLALAKKIAQEAFKREESFGTVIEDEGKPVSTPDFAVPEDTSGKKVLKELKKAVDDAQAKQNEGPLQAAQAAKAERNLRKEMAKRDERTGLYQRGVYFQTMERGLKENMPVTNVSIDMAFLKYFDKEGGPAAGNLAISKAAEILDVVAHQFSTEGIEVQAYRVGGDEFALTILGGDEDAVKKILEAVRTSSREAGRVPPQPGAKPTYASESLQFNYGVRTAPDEASFRNELEAAGIPLKEKGTDKEQNELADYLVRLADKEVEIQKGVNRIVLLMNRTVEAKRTEQPGNLETLKAYSEKAVFGGAGMAKIEEFASRLEVASDPQTELGKIRGEALAFVIEQIDKKNEQVADFESSLDRRMEDAVRIRYFENRISDLEEEIDMLRAQIGKEKGENIHLKRAKAAAEEEKSAIVQLRERMQSGPPSTKVPPPLRKAA